MKTNFSAATAKSFKVFANSEYTNVYSVMKCLQGCFASVHVSDLQATIKALKVDVDTQKGIVAKDAKDKEAKMALKLAKANLAHTKALYERAKCYKVDAEVRKSIKAAKEDGITVDSFSLEYILNGLKGTDFVQDGKVMMKSKKSETGWAVVERWSIARALIYVRRANREIRKNA